MRAVYFTGRNRDGKARHLRQGKAFANARVVRRHAQHARHNGLVCAVAAVGFGKAAVQKDVGPHRPLAQQRAGNAPQPRGACRVAGGRAYHHRPNDVKHVHKSTPFRAFLCAAAGRGFARRCAPCAYCTTFARHMQRSPCGREDGALRPRRAVLRGPRLQKGPALAAQHSAMRKNRRGGGRKFYLTRGETYGTLKIVITHIF